MSVCFFKTSSCVYVWVSITLVAHLHYTNHNTVVTLVTILGGLDQHAISYQQEIAIMPLKCYQYVNKIILTGELVYFQPGPHTFLYMPI